MWRPERSCAAYSWLDGDGSPGHVLDVGALRLRDRLVAEKLSDVKG